MDTKLVYPELSYKLVGLCFDLYNEIGPGYQEKYYQRAFAVKLKENKLKFERELRVPLNISNNAIGYYKIDFLVENKIVIEFKSGDRFRKQNFDQVYGYLKSKKLKLGMLVNFTKNGVIFKRVLNIR